MSILTGEKKLIIYSAVGYTISMAMMFSPISMLSGALPGIWGIIPVCIALLIGGLLIGVAYKRIKLFVVSGVLGYVAGFIFALLIFFLLNYLHYRNLGVMFAAVPLFTGIGMGTGLTISTGTYLAEKSKMASRIS